MNIAQAILQTPPTAYGRRRGTSSETECRRSFGLVTLFSQYIPRVPVPCPSYTKSKGLKFSPFLMFQSFPIILSILTTWLFCYVLTATNVLPSAEGEAGYQARTDIKIDQLKDVPWFYVPYPGQFGRPVISSRGLLGVIAGCIASIIESIGDYNACAKLAGAPPPPFHAINRGIGFEGVGGVLSALWGSGPASTSYSGNIATIGLTKVASRLVLQVMCLFSISTGIFLKASAFMATIPSPVIGGSAVTLTGVLLGVGLSNLQYVNMNLPRNMFVVGVSFFFGLVAPTYIKANPDAINTGSKQFDDLLTVLLRTNMFIGGLVAFLLDNTLPGSRQDRGLIKIRAVQGNFASVPDNDDDGDDDERECTHLGPMEGEAVQREVARIVNRCYDLPLGMSYIRAAAWTRRVPFCPTFGSFRTPASCGRRNNSATVI